jgi:hypothetical protein
MRAFFFFVMFLSVQMFTQNMPLKGKIVDIEIRGYYPLISDTQLKTNSNRTILYPLLVVNDVAIRDTAMVNHFRNQYSVLNSKTLLVKSTSKRFLYIKKIKHLTAKEAEKLNFSNIPKDGVLFVYTKKGVIIDI